MAFHRAKLASISSRSLVACCGEGSILGPAWAASTADTWPIGPPSSSAADKSFSDPYCHSLTMDADGMSLIIEAVFDSGLPVKYKSGCATRPSGIFGRTESTVTTVAATSFGFRSMGPAISGSKHNVLFKSECGTLTFDVTKTNRK